MLGTKLSMLNCMHASKELNCLYSIALYRHGITAQRVGGALGGTSRLLGCRVLNYLLFLESNEIGFYGFTRFCPLSLDFAYKHP